jgi:hypothetical protein
MPAFSEALSPAPQVKNLRFAAFHRGDRDFFLTFLLLCLLGVALGFAPAVADRVEGHPRIPARLILDIHMASFSAWIVLLSIQILIVRSRNTLVHMSLGLSAFALVPIMAVSALVSEAYSQRFHHSVVGESFFIVPIFEILAFTSLATAALLARKRPATHKRLILMATAVIVGAAYGRWWDNALIRLFGDGYFGTLVNTYTGCNMLLVIAVGYDFVTRGRPHRIYLIAVPMILLGEVVTSVVYHWPPWLPVARMLIGI